MHKKEIIRRFSAGFILVLFAFSITPRIVLHNGFASHKDAIGIKSGQAGHQLVKSTFNCNCDNIVAESPFTEPEAVFEAHILPSFLQPQKPPTCSFYQTDYFSFGLRGPPVKG